MAFVAAAAPELATGTRIALLGSGGGVAGPPPGPDLLQQVVSTLLALAFAPEAIAAALTAWYGPTVIHDANTVWGGLVSAGDEAAGVWSKIVASLPHL